MDDLRRYHDGTNISGTKITKITKITKRVQDRDKSGTLKEIGQTWFGGRREATRRSRIARMHEPACEDRTVHAFVRSGNVPGALRGPAAEPLCGFSGLRIFIASLCPLCSLC